MAIKKEHQLTTRVGIRTTEKEFLLLSKKAEKLGLAPSRLARQVLIEWLNKSTTHA